MGGVDWVDVIRSGDSRVVVDYSGELDGLAHVLQLAVDAKMVAPEGPRSYDGNAQWMRGEGHYFFSVFSVFPVIVSAGASTTWRQRA